MDNICDRDANRWTRIVKHLPWKEAWRLPASCIYRHDAELDVIIIIT